MLRRLDAIRQVLLAAAERNRTAKQQVETAIADAQRIGSTEPGGGPVPNTPVLRPPPHVDAIGRDLPARSAFAPTTGDFRGERIHSSDDLSSVADLRGFPRGGWPMVLVRHVESHVAARMRRQRLTEGTLVHNNPTCGTRGFDNDYPNICDKLLPSIPPAGSRLTVWATPDGGRTWRTKTYTGTGERIEP
jgi:hypothetical protein